MPLLSTRWWRRFALALALVTVVTAAGYGSGLWYIESKFATANEVELELDPGPPANFLVLGSDSRAFVDNPEDAESFGDIGSTLADTIIVVRLIPGQGKALLVSFPRDLWVEVPGRGDQKINASFADGPQGVINTLRHNFGIPIHHYAEVDFAGFRNIVNAMGGVEMYVAAPSRDAKTGLDIPEAGCITLDGDQALAWVRSRQYEYFEGGEWHGEGSGDFGRIERQQDFIRRLMAQSIESASTNPVRGNRLVDRTLENVVVDSELSVGDVFKLVRVFRSSDPQDVEMLTVPAVNGSRGGASVVLHTEDADEVFARLRGELEEGTATPGTTSIRVLNGVGTAGLATQTGSDLQAAGFAIRGAADAATFDYDQTEIRHRADQQEKAELVQSYLGGVGEFVEDDQIGEVDVVVILGSDFEGVEPPNGDAAVSGDPALPMSPIAAVHGQEGPDSAQAPPDPAC